MACAHLFDLHWNLQTHSNVFNGKTHPESLCCKIRKVKTSSLLFTMNEAALDWRGRPIIVALIIAIEDARAYGTFSYVDR